MTLMGCYIDSIHLSLVCLAMLIDQNLSSPPPAPGPAARTRGAGEPLWLQAGEGSESSHTSDLEPEHLDQRPAEGLESLVSPTGDVTMLFKARS